MKNNFELQINEVMEYDVDDSIENELQEFYGKIKDMKLSEVKEFKNWLKIYKAMNYDIFPDLIIENIYKFNNYSAVIEINFKGLKEYDLLYMNESDLTVTVMNVKEGMVKTQKARRLLIPQNPEEALKYASSQLYFNDIDNIGITIDDIKNNGDKYNVTEQLKDYLCIKENREGKELSKEEKEKEMNKSVNREPLDKKKIEQINKKVDKDKKVKVNKTPIILRCLGIKK